MDTDEPGLRRIHAALGTEFGSPDSPHAFARHCSNTAATTDSNQGASPRRCGSLEFDEPDPGDEFDDDEFEADDDDDDDLTADLDALSARRTAAVPRDRHTMRRQMRASAPAASRTDPIYPLVVSEITAVVDRIVPTMR